MSASDDFHDDEELVPSDDIDGVSSDEYDDVGEQTHDEGEYRFDDPAGEDTSNIVFLTKLWGSSTQVQIVGFLSSSTGITVQVADVRMPEPLTCSVFFQAQFAAGQGSIDGLQLEQQIGLGRTTITKRWRTNSQPTPNDDLVQTFEFVPMITYLANVTIVGTASPTSTQFLPDPAGGGGSVPAFTLNLSIEVAPITRAKVTSTHERWGMALPGEADAMDDALRIPAPQPPPAPPAPTHDQRALLQMVVNQLTKRLGRRPSPAEVRAALARMEVRRARRNQPNPLRRAFIEHTIAVLTSRLGRKPSKDELRQELARSEVPE
jgi:hypothetical protein